MGDKTDLAGWHPSPWFLWLPATGTASKEKHLTMPLCTVTQPLWFHSFSATLTRSECCYQGEKKHLVYNKQHCSSRDRLSLALAQMRRAINKHMRSFALFLHPLGKGRLWGRQWLLLLSAPEVQNPPEVPQKWEPWFQPQSRLALGCWPAKKEHVCCYLFWAEPLRINAYQHTLPYVRSSFEMLWRCVTDHQNSQDLVSSPFPWKEKINRIELCSETNSVSLNTSINIHAFSI